MEKMIGRVWRIENHCRTNLATCLPWEEYQLSLQLRWQKLKWGQFSIAERIILDFIASAHYLHICVMLQPEVVFFFKTGLDPHTVRNKQSKDVNEAAMQNNITDVYLCVVRCHQSHVADLVLIQIWDTKNRHSAAQTRRLRLLPADVTCTHT